MLCSSSQISHFAGDSLPSEPLGKPKNTGVCSLSLLQGIFPTQEWNLSLLHCRQFFTSWASREMFFLRCENESHAFISLHGNHVSYHYPYNESTSFSAREERLKYWEGFQNTEEYEKEKSGKTLPLLLGLLSRVLCRSLLNGRRITWWWPSKACNESCFMEKQQVSMGKIWIGGNGSGQTHFQNLDISFPNGREFGHYCLIRLRPMGKHTEVNL